MKRITSLILSCLLTAAAVAQSPGSNTGSFGRDQRVNVNAQQLGQDSTDNPAFAPSQIFPGSQSCVAGGSVSWNGAGGISCTGQTSAIIAHQANGTVSDNTAPNTGTTTVTCNNGTLVATTPQSCVAAATACTGTNVNWTVGSNTCNGFAPTTNSGSSTSVSDSTAPTLGSATYSCNNGTFTPSGQTCGRPCPSTNVTWSTAGVSCSGTLPAANPDAISGTTSSGPNSGAATYQCNGQTGAFNSTPNSSFCSPPSGCAGGGTTTWTVSATCSGFLPTLNNGQSGTVTSSNGNSGSVTVNCNSGTFTQSSPTCTGSTPSASCPAGSAVSWSVGANTCNGTLPGTVPSGSSSATVTDSTAPTTGSSTFFCNNGSLTQNGGATCNATAASCPAGSAVSWSVGGNTCNGTLASQVASGSSSPSVTDNTAPTTGSSTFTCNNGSLTQNGGATCNAAATNCPAGSAVSWNVGGNTCNGTLPANVANGAVSGTVTDSTAPTTGSTTFFCNNGSPIQNGAATCNASANCGQQTLSWTVGAATCSGNTPASTASGSSASVSSINGSSGTASFPCNNGSFASTPTSSTCTAPPATPSTTNWCVNVVTTRHLVSTGDLATYPANRSMEFAIIAGSGGQMCSQQAFSNGLFCTPNGGVDTAVVSRGTFLPTFPFETFVGGGGGAGFMQDANNLFAGAGASGWYGGGGGGHVADSGTDPNRNRWLSAGPGGSTAIVNRTTNAIVAPATGGTQGLAVSTGGRGGSGGSPSYVTLGTSAGGGRQTTGGSASNYGGQVGSALRGGDAEALTGGGIQVGTGGNQGTGGSNGGGSNGANGSSGMAGPAGGGGFGGGGGGLSGQGGLGANSFASQAGVTGPNGPENIVMPAEAGRQKTDQFLQGGNAGLAILRYRPNTVNPQCIPGFTLR